MNPAAPLTQEESAFLIKALWEGLITPAWTSDELIALGKAVYAKTKLSSMEPELLGRLLPHLKTIASVLAAKVSSAPATPASPPAPQPPTEVPHE